PLSRIASVDALPKGEVTQQRRFHDQNAICPVLSRYITLVRVTTDTKVPTSTATEAGSTQVSYCLAMTKTFSAGGNEAISTAVAAHSGVNGPNEIISAKAISGWMISFTAITPGTSQGIRANGRS